MTISPALNLTTRRPSVDRRQHRRYPIMACAECVFEDRRIEVVTTDISSAGILVQPADTLPNGARVELRMDWPLRLEGRFPLRLVLAGEVLETTARGTVISVVRYEYRLAPKAAVSFG